MTMTTKQIKNGTGIYVQELAGVTTAGDGLGPRGDKSPVAYIKETKIEINKSEATKDYPHFSGNVGIKEDDDDCIIIEDEYISDQKQPVLAPEIAGTNINKIPFGKRLRERSKSPKASRIRIRPQRSRQNFYRQFFQSPAIKAGATEADSSYSAEGRKRKADNIIQITKQLRVDGFEEARRRMGLRGRHIRRRNSSEDSPPPDDNSQKNRIEMKNIKYPLEVQISDRSNPFGEIPVQYRKLLVNALETTEQDERAIGGFLVKLGLCEYKRKILIVHYKNEETLRFLQENIPLYNRLWPEADLYISNEEIIHKRYKIRVRIPNFNITSEEFFKIIGKQNGFPTKHWPLMYKTDSFGFTAIFGVDKGSYERLKKSNGYVYFFFDKIFFELDVK